ncbi:DUF2062 domain-containing protein [Emcibacter sp.]|uniref:DUF2062 domain-containing protein n=1 Tax=Emcibacter sp. TaxID=1979954 RepID=UPI003A8E3F19
MTRVQDFLWPALGWRRAFSYMHHRVARIPGTSYALAAGFASGAAMSFTPFVGFHFILAATFAWIIRGNILTSAMGTIVGNPWTFPFIWVATYETGSWLLGWEAQENMWGGMMEAANQVTFGGFFVDPLKALAPVAPYFHSVFLPMLLGGMVLGAIAWGTFYWPIYKLVSEYKRKRFEKRMQALEKKLSSSGHEDIGEEGTSIW